MTIKFQAKGNRGEIWIYDPIGEDFWSGGVSAKQFQKELSGLGNVTTINVRINSPGGDVFDGFAIYNQLMAHPADIEVDVDGVAASIASIVAMAGNTIRMAKNSMMMIHNPQGIAVGDANEMERVKALLEQVKGNLITTYVDRTGNSKTDVSAWMDDETWFTAEAAVERGFADVVTNDSKVAACFDLSRFRNVPQTLRERLTAAVPKPALDIHRARIARVRQVIAAGAAAA